VNFLVARKQFENAQDAWISQYSVRQDGYSRLSPVFNGGFENEFTGGIPDWRIEPLKGLSARRDHAPVFEGQYSLRIDFTGNDNADFHQVQETVFVEPGEYRLEAHVMTRDITSEQGIRLRVVSPENRILGETDDIIGTSDWKRLTAAVVVPPGVRLANLQIARRRSLRIDNQLTGTAWVDAVKLIRIP
jgi:hypothetical protein